MSKVIYIKNIETNDNHSVNFILSIDGKEEVIHTSYSDNLSSHLTADRADAVVMGLIYFAIKNGYDIVSDIPVSAELMYNLDDYFIDSFIDNPGYHRVKIQAQTIDTIDRNGDIVATGLSCGVDSLYTIMTHMESPSSKVRLTNTAFFDVGSHETSDPEKTKRLFEGRREFCRKFANECELPLLEIQSDIHRMIGRYDQNGYRHIEYDSFMMAFCVLLFQRGIRSYLCSSSNVIANFKTLKDYPSEILGCDSFDLLTMVTGSINGMTLYSSGGSILRVDKIKILCEWPLAWNYLNVCVDEVNNCSHCNKCVRTLMAIDAVGDVDKFAKVFDVEYFKKHRKEYLRKLYMDGYINKSLIVRELFPYYKKQLTVGFKIGTYIRRWLSAIKRRIHI